MSCPQTPRSHDEEPSNREESSPHDAQSTDEIFPLVYQELRRLAREELSNEREGHTLQPTALVSEAYLRLVGTREQSWENRAHFFGAASRALRRILVDHARAKGRDKRGSGRRQVTLSGVLGPSGPSEIDVVALDEALRRLDEIDPLKARLIDLRFFSGLEMKEISQILGRSEASLARDWTFTKAWLHRELHP